MIFVPTIWWGINYLRSHFGVGKIKPLQGSLYPDGGAPSYATFHLEENYLYGLAATIEERAYVNRIGIEVIQGGKDQKIRVGIFQLIDGKPGPLLLDAGIVEADTTALIETTISYVFTPGTYVLALISNGTPVIRGIVLDEATTIRIWNNEGMWVNPCWAKAMQYFGPLPSTFGNVEFGTGAGPNIWLRSV